MSEDSLGGQRVYVGTDIGGTFTDLVVLAGGRRPRLYKSPTTPDNRANGVLDALELAADDHGMDISQFCQSIAYFAHGTTAATNALIERQGAPTALLTTRGFRDTMLIQRSTGSWAGLGADTGHYSRRRNPDPIVPRQWLTEVTERVDATGTQLVRLDVGEVRTLLRGLVDAGVSAVAVSLLWSFVNPRHERQIAELVETEFPELYLTVSHEMAPVIGEYERTATTVVNSYLGPVIRDYIAGLGDRLAGAGFAGEVSIMDSGGGVMRAGDAARRGAAMLTSGPAGGVLASAALARTLGHTHVITSDMGGTSFDVGLIVDGEPVSERTGEVGGLQLALPRIKVTAIGAGGGSIAWVDEVGALVVGPRSAGAVPGPACYGRGGTRPTVTDADVVLGVIDPDYFLGGRMKLDRALAEEAISRQIAGPLGMSVAQAAAGIRRVADNQMADLLRKVTVEQGHDPRDFVVYAYGGAGPTHAYAYTEAAGISTLVVPPTATVHSAFGTVTADRYRAVQATEVQRSRPGSADPAADFDIGRVRTVFADLQARCHADLDDDPRAVFRRIAYFRFTRQAHELPITLPEGELSAAMARHLVSEFFAAYERLYGAGTTARGAGVETHTLRVEGRVRVTDLAPSEPAAGGEPLLIGSRPVWFTEHDAHDTPVYRGESLPAGTELTGPLVAEFAGTTVVAGPGHQVRVDDQHNLIITCEGAGS